MVIYGCITYIVACVACVAYRRERKKTTQKKWFERLIIVDTFFSPPTHLVARFIRCIAWWTAGRNRECPCGACAFNPWLYHSIHSYCTHADQLIKIVFILSSSNLPASWSRTRPCRNCMNPLLYADSTDGWELHVVMCLTMFLWFFACFFRLSWKKNSENMLYVEFSISTMHSVIHTFDRTIWRFWCKQLDSGRPPDRLSARQPYCCERMSRIESPSLSLILILAIVIHSFHLRFWSNLCFNGLCISVDLGIFWAHWAHTFDRIDRMCMPYAQFSSLHRVLDCWWNCSHFELHRRPILSHFLIRSVRGVVRRYVFHGHPLSAVGLKSANINIIHVDIIRIWNVRNVWTVRKCCWTVRKPTHRKWMMLAKWFGQWMWRSCVSFH